MTTLYNCDFNGKGKLCYVADNKKEIIWHYFKNHISTLQIHKSRITKGENCK